MADGGALPAAYARLQGIHAYRALSSAKTPGAAIFADDDTFSSLTPHVFGGDGASGVVAPTAAAEGAPALQQRAVAPAR
jgi:hypothetical protein